MGLAFVLIFVAFILLNIVAGVIQQRKKRGAAGTGAGRAQTAPRSRETGSREMGPRERRSLNVSTPRDQPEVSFLEEQNASSLLTAHEPDQPHRQVFRQEKVQRPRRGTAKPAAPGARVQAERSGRGEAGGRAGGKGPAQAGGLLEQRAAVEPPQAGYVSSPVLRGNAWKHIQELPQLKQAVVLSEVMGKPRGLEDLG